MAKNSLNHALHNEKVCKYLNKKPENGDWVITTAFYSARHFLEYKIFPIDMDVNGKKITITGFDKYCLINGTTRSKHSVFTELVEEKTPELADHYNHLKDSSWTARYSRYEYDRDIVNIALDRFKIIKSKCSAVTKPRIFCEAKV